MKFSKALLHKIFIIAVLLFNCTLCVVKAQDFGWAKSMGGYESDYVFSITSDAAGNVYTTGFYGGDADFNPDSGAFNFIYTGAFITKQDPAGNFIWAKLITDVVGKSVVTDQVGNCYIMGNFKNTADFDPGAGTYEITTTDGTWSVFIVKLNALGDFVWAKNFEGKSSYITGNEMSIDPLGNLYTTGYFKGIIDFDPGADTFNVIGTVNANVFISKLNANGNFEWAKSIGGVEEEEGFAITTDKNGNVYTTGYFYHTVDFDPDTSLYYLTAAGSTDIFIVKLNTSGKFVWAKSLGGVDSDVSYDITVDKAGNVLTTGSFQQTADFDPNHPSFTLTSNGKTEIFISKIDSMGNFVWAKAIGGEGSDDGCAVNTDSTGNIYLSGAFEMQVDFDPGNETFFLNSFNGSNDIFVSKLDGLGNFVWAKAIGDKGSDWGQAITNDENNNVYITGCFGDTVDFNPGSNLFKLGSEGNADVFVMKLNQNITGLKDENKTTAYFNIHPNPSLGKCIIDVKNMRDYYELTITNILGQIISTKHYQEQTLEIDLSDQTNGTYFIQLKTENEIVTRKLIIAK